MPGSEGLGQGLVDAVGVGGTFGGTFDRRHEDDCAREILSVVGKVLDCSSYGRFGLCVRCTVHTVPLGDDLILVSERFDRDDRESQTSREVM